MEISKFFSFTEKEKKNDAERNAYTKLLNIRKHTLADRLWNMSP